MNILVKTGEKPEQEKAPEVAEPALVESTEVATPEPAARWSVHPIQRYTIGDYKFEDGLLTLATEEEAAKFQDVYDSLPESERIRVKKIDVDAAIKISQAVRAAAGGTTQSIDSSVGDRAGATPVGTGALGDSNNS